MSGQVTHREGQRIAVQESYYAGPLPPAAEMERYAALDPDAVTVILGQFTEQGRHRRALEAALVTGNERRADRGQWLAALLVGLGIGGGVVIATAGSAPLPGAGLSAAAIGSAALIYVIGGRSPKPDD